MAVARVIRMDVRCVKTHCLLSCQGGYDHRGVLLRGLVGDCGKDFLLKRIVLLIPTSRFTESAVNVKFTALLFWVHIRADTTTELII